MAHTLFSRRAMRRCSSPRFVEISSSGRIETIMGKKNGDGKLSPAITSKVEQAVSHYTRLGAEKMCAHNLSVLGAGIDAKFIDPHADESDMLSMELTCQALYHSLTSDSHLPTDVSFSSRFMRTFELQRKFNHLDSRKGGDKMPRYVEFLNDRSHDATSLLIALYTRIADMMTIHDRLTATAATTRMPGVFPVHRNWSEVQTAWSEPMLKIYCPMADWGGHTHAYRQMRDNAMQYSHPRYFMEAAIEVQKRKSALEMTNRFIFGVLQEMARRTGINMIIAPDYRVVSKVFHRVGDDTVAVALKPFKGVGGLLNKSLKRGVPLEWIHDWAGLTVITGNESQMYTIASFLQGGALSSVAAGMGVRDVCLCHFQDYAANPKPVTNYQSVHVDSASPGMQMMPAEFIVRTLEMHRKADEGEASHDRYKESPLVNGERKRFMQRLAEISASTSHSRD